MESGSVLNRWKDISQLLNVYVCDIRHIEMHAAEAIIIDSRLTDGGKVVSLMHRLPLTPRSIPGTHFC
jgi:hypothetical protein